MFRTPASSQGPIFVALLFALVAQVEAASKRPSSTAEGCTLSGPQLDELKGKNPGAMNACGDLANRAASEGRSFSFICDAGGESLLLRRSTMHHCDGTSKTNAAENNHSAGVRNPTEPWCRKRAADIFGIRREVMPVLNDSSSSGLSREVGFTSTLTGR